MVYANDQWVQLPVRDLYDSQIMAMAINAAKDMYDKGLQEMKDFNKEYGDFITPIAADQEKYDQAVTSRIRNVVNAIYAAGGDPLRDPQARMIINRELANMPTKDIAMWRQRAENAKDYYKNMATLKQKGLYSEDYSRFLKEDPSQWAENYAGIASPSAYDDLNSHTSHWFDKVNREGFIGVDDKTGENIYGVRPDDLRAVMDQQMPDFLSTGYGKYQYYLAQQQLGPDASNSDIIEKVKDNIVSANKELTINPTRKLSDRAKLELQDEFDAREKQRAYNYWKKQYDYEVAHPKPTSRGRDTKDDDGEYDSSEGMFNRGFIHSGGGDYIDDPNDAIEYARDNIIDRQLALRKSAPVGSDTPKIRKYILDNTSIEEDHNHFAYYLRQESDDFGNVAITDYNLDDIYDDKYITDNIYGLKQKDKKTGQGNSDVSAGDIMVPSKKVATLFFRDTDGEYKIGQFWKVNVYEADNNNSPDTSKFKGTKYVKMPNTRAATTNMPDIGYYNYYRQQKKKTGKSNDKYRPNITPDYSTKGLKNSGSLRVNKDVSAPTKMSFNGTYNSEAMRK